MQFYLNKIWDLKTALKYAETTEVGLGLRGNEINIQA